MFVREWMTPKVITVHEDLPLIEAYRIFHEYEIRHLPVVSENDRLIGIISKRDIGSRVLRKLPSDGLGDLGVVKQAMAVNVIAVSPDDSIHDAALHMHNNKISALPVAKAGKVVGIITTDDMLEVLVSVHAKEIAGS